MDYEKKYRDLVEAVKELQEANPSDEGIQKWIEDNVPQLAKSKDEKTRKYLIILLQHFCKGYRVPGLEFPISFKDMLIWLEKQKPMEDFNGEDYGIDSLWHAITILEKTLGEVEGYQTDDGILEHQCAITAVRKLAKERREQKSVKEEEILHEPKFKVGDWVILDRPVLITKVEDMPYNTHQYWTSDGTWFGDGTNAKLWTIQDAKDGDVLSTNDNRPFIFRGLLDPNHPNCPVAYGGIDSEGYFIVSRSNNWWDDESVKPATKEQCEQLEEAIEGAGYVWFSGKKELKKIEEETTCKLSDEHYELEEFAKIVRCNLTGISKAVQQLFEAKYLQLTGNKMYGGFKD